MNNKKLYFDLCERLGQVREDAIKHISAYLAQTDEEHPAKCDISLHDALPYGMDIEHVTAMYLEEGNIYFTYGNDEVGNDIECLSTEEVLAILYEIL